MHSADNKTRKTLELHAVDVNDLMSSVEMKSESSVSKTIQTRFDKSCVEGVLEGGGIKENSLLPTCNRSNVLSSSRSTRIAKLKSSHSNQDAIPVEFDSSVLSAMKMPNSSHNLSSSIQVGGSKPRHELLMYQDNDDTLDLSTVSCLTGLELGSSTSSFHSNSKFFCSLPENTNRFDSYNSLP